MIARTDASAGISGILPWIQCALLAALLSSGCVRRTVTVNTDPQGAAVVLNDRSIGTSPVSVDFTWYGDYSVILKKEGYQTLDTHQRLSAPWYQVPPLDFFSEALTPFWIHDQKQMIFSLEREQPIDRDQLIQQAQEFRDRTLYEGDHGSASNPSP